MKIVLFILFNSSLLFSFSQINSLYLSETFSFQYNTSIGLPNMRDFSSFDDAVPILHYEFLVDYHLFRNTSLGVRYKLATDMPFAENKFKVLPINVDYKPAYYSHSVGVVYKFYLYDDYQPTEGHIKLGLDFQSLIYNSAKKTSEYSLLINDYVYKVEDQKYWDIMLNVGIGENYLIGDYFLFGVGANVGLPLRAFFDDLSGDELIPNKIKYVNILSEILTIGINFGLYNDFSEK